MHKIPNSKLKVVEVLTLAELCINIPDFC
uniref:Uncharacterized protein n=1 Tax=Ciona intestinalis TaxID=7719 RepID=H2XNU3_CIOIN